VFDFFEYQENFFNVIISMARSVLSSVMMVEDAPPQYALVFVFERGRGVDFLLRYTG
jgi:hypothetical protein